VPRSIIFFRLGTALVTLLLVALVMRVLGERPSARYIAGGVFAFGLLQWFFLGRLGRAFIAEDQAMGRVEPTVRVAEDNPLD
jgi:hypothetical protein